MPRKKKAEIAQRNFLAEWAEIIEQTSFKSDILTRPQLGRWSPMESAPQDQRILATVDGVVRVVAWGKTSHVPLYGFCLADQGAEEFDLCRPSAWMPLPPPHDPSEGAP